MNAEEALMHWLREFDRASGKSMEALQNCNAFQELLDGMDANTILTLEDNDSKPEAA